MNGLVLLKIMGNKRTRKNVVDILTKLGIISPKKKKNKKEKNKKWRRIDFTLVKIYKHKQKK